MKAWRLHGKGGLLTLDDVPKPLPRPGGVVVKMEAAPVLSYMRQVIDGTLGYALPAVPFVPGTNGIGVLDTVGEGVYHLEPGKRVALNPLHLANERVRDPAQILIGLTAMGSARFAGLEAATNALQADWPDGVFAEYAHLPAAVATPLEGLGGVPAERLAALAKFVVPYGGGFRGGVPARGAGGVHGAAGGVCFAAGALAPAMGAGGGRGARGAGRGGGPRSRGSARRYRGRGLAGRCGQSFGRCGRRRGEPPSGGGGRRRPGARSRRPRKERGFDDCGSARASSRWPPDSH